MSKRPKCLRSLDFSCSAYRVSASSKVTWSAGNGAAVMQSLLRGRYGLVRPSGTRPARAMEPECGSDFNRQMGVPERAGLSDLASHAQRERRARAVARIDVAQPVVRPQGVDRRGHRLEADDDRVE